MDQSSHAAAGAGRVPEGTLFYVVGMSGKGKVRLLQYARARLGEDQLVVFAHRYIAQCDVNREHEVRLSAAEFALRKRHGLFAMSWERGGLLYGVGTEINYWLARGLSVVVNGSRAYLGQALVDYPDMTVIWVAPDTEAAARLAARRVCELRPSDTGRAAASSWNRARARGSRVVHIGNHGALSQSGNRLVSVLAGDANGTALATDGQEPGVSAAGVS